MKNDILSFLSKSVQNTDIDAAARILIQPLVAQEMSEHSADGAQTQCGSQCGWYCSSADGPSAL